MRAFGQAIEDGTQFFGREIGVRDDLEIDNRLKPCRINGIAEEIG